MAVKEGIATFRPKDERSIKLPLHVFGFCVIWYLEIRKVLGEGSILVVGFLAEGYEQCSLALAEYLAFPLLAVDFQCHCVGLGVT